MNKKIILVLSVLFSYMVFSFSLFPNDAFATMTSETTEEESSSRIHKIGETANVGGLDVTVQSLTVTEDHGDGRRLILNVSIFNHSEEEIDVLGNNMKLLNHQGKNQCRIIANEKRAVPTITINPAEVHDEQIIFEIEDLGIYNFTFRNPFYTGEAYWSIDLSE
ncbi:hypothetical protein BKP45_13935 [Anaerobacillus alkalidiazotrophicus]|uniref:DUF4352 domain-containing protein n=1 Tax=Anaerobacillus alkalidiazotrophicus TaxID=472963 RepID=A0A1S2M3N9_9BACI|nr:DUF4352 domain-containing protein [Anaerobacillus alkalidiazotrophicus]OIJ19254.1 hypothetical protein BKP45_13935 [Anaerobacillus alkalidiazotrophicus]